ncbi:MAG: SpoIID/LytB domain-containing protein [Clostridiales bacterium]|nr:SpoIID/LytB domain-containing protein [Clostridiales bacterium]
MRRKLHRLLRTVLPTLLSAMLLIGGTPYAGASSPLNTTIRVALRHAGNGTDVSSASLVNYVGHGFYFGYFDSSRNFVKNSVETAVGATSLDITVSGSTITVTNRQTSQMLYQIDTNTNYPLAIMPIPGPGEKCVTWLGSVKYYGAFEFSALSNGYMQVVNVLNIDDYLKGVVPEEMMPYWPLEALKAQAMCARNYVMTHLNSHGSFDVCNTTCCQVYGGLTKASAATDAAVDQTSGLFIRFNGELCQTYYHSSNGGATESSCNIWVTQLPYLTGRIDEYDTTIYTGFDNWSYTYTADEITDILNTKGYSIGTITSVVPTYTATGNMYSMTFSDGNVSLTFSKSAARSILDSSRYGKYTYSQRFRISSALSSPTGLYINSGANSLDNINSVYAVGGAGDISKVKTGGGNISVLTGSGLKTVNASGSGVVQTGSSFVVTGSGWGHNVGMSQYGAKAMAQAGKTFDEIIKYYFSGVSIG